MHSQRTSYDYAKNAALWEVDDSFLSDPQAKFQKTCQPLLEATVEMWGCYQFDQVKVMPREMLEFVSNFTESLGLVPSRFSSVKNICHVILSRIDYEEPYFFLVDTLIQMSHNELTHAYRHKKTGDILNPARLETFRLERDWKFRPFWDVKAIMEEPRIINFLNNNVIPTKPNPNGFGPPVPLFESREEALLSLFSKIASVVWGQFGWLENMVEEALSQEMENVIYDERVTNDAHARDEVMSCLAHDKLFWMAASLGLVTWLKGPKAVRFLTEYHTVYDNLLRINDDGTLTPWPDTGDEVIIDGSIIYTHKDLECLPNRAPDICARCGVHAHCSKELNLTALMHPTCSCGGTIDPTIIEEVYGHHNSRDCQPYRNAHAIRTGFVCQRCIFVTVNQLGDHTKCGRTICPAVTCPHHMGPHARVQALTHQRTKQLTAPQRG